MEQEVIGMGMENQAMQCYTITPTVHMVELNTTETQAAQVNHDQHHTSCHMGHDLRVIQQGHPDDQAGKPGQGWHTS